MAVTPVNLTRVSFNQQIVNLREALRVNQTGLYGVQNQLTTGLRFLQPSDDPSAAASANALDRRLESLGQVATNVRNANAVLTEGESSASDAVDAVREAQSLAVSAVGDTMTPDERQALAPVVCGLLQQLVDAGNRRYQNTYLYSGQQNRAPFELSHGGVYYTGDGNRMVTAIDSDGSTAAFTIPGLELFNAVSQVRGAADLDPALTADTRISDLGGAAGRGVQLGHIIVTVGDERKEIDLSGCATVGDLVERLNAELPAGLAVSLGTRGLVLTLGDGRSATVADIGGGRSAIDLGLAGTLETATRDGADLNPRLTRLTRLGDLRGGAGVDLSHGFVIRNGTETATIAPDRAETVEDLLNLINQANVGVWARIAPDGRSLEVVSRVSGVDLSIEEDGGSLATALGLRTMHAGTKLADLNDGQGVQTVDGADLRVTTSSGDQIDVDLDGATTLQDVLDRLNTAGAGRITAGFVNSGNGLAITDQTRGAGTLSVAALGSSPALAGLGLNVTATGNQLLGRDVNPVRVDSPFTALLQLSRGLQGDDRQAVQAAAQRLDRTLQNMQQVQGQMASQAKTMADRTERVDTETTATRTLLSDVQDVDFTDATLRFQQLQTALQANLVVGSKLMNLSLLNFLT